MNPDILHADWRISVRSQEGSSCVEVAKVPGVVGVRDSKDRAGGHLEFTPAEVGRLFGRIRSGSLDL